MTIFAMQFSQYVEGDHEIRILVDQVLGHHAAHSHQDFIEIAYVESGRGTQTVNGQTAEIHPGDLFMFNAQVVHAFDSSPKEPLVIYNCLFQPLSIDSSLKDCRNFLDVVYHYLFHSLYTGEEPGGYVKLDGLKGGEAEHILHEMYAEYDRKEKGYRQILRADLMKLLIVIFRLYEKGDQQRKNLPIYKRLIAQEAAAYLRSHYAENIRCEELAGRAYLSVNYFRGVFKEITGMTVVQMLQNIRINAACDLLIGTDLPVVDIAGQVGYADLKYFYKLFGQMKAVTPKEYRMRNRVQ